MLRLLEIFVGETGGEWKKLVIIQEIYRRDPKKMKGCKMRLLDDVKRFEIWIDILIDNNFVEPEFFEGKTIMVRNNFAPYTAEMPSLKEYQLKKVNQFQSNFPMEEENIRVIDLSGYVFLEFKFHKIANDRRIGDKVFIPVKVDEGSKPDSNDFCKLLVLEAYRDGVYELPEYPKGAEMFTCYARLELAPDSKNNSGSTISEYEFKKAKKGEID